MQILNRLFQIARIIILARLLSPNDFGLFSIALLTLSALDTFSQTGFRQALIQKKEDIKPYLDTAWTVGIIKGFLIAAILFFAAPYVAIFFKSPPAEPILKIIGLAIILQSLTNIAVIYFEKELEFHKYFIYQFAGTIFDVTVAISAAFLLRSVWALVFGLLARNLVRCIMSYVIHLYRPSFELDRGKFRELFNFGKYIFVQSIILFLLTQGDDAFVGKVIGTTALGFYQIAYRISNLAATEITHVVSMVTFPVYSKLQDEVEKLKRVLKITLKFTTFISIPVASGILILAPEFTKVFLGDKWMLMVPAMQVLCLFGVMRSIGASFGPIYLAIAKVNIPLKINIIQLVLLATIIYPLSLYWGITGTAVAITLCIIVSLCLNSKKIMEVLDIDFVSLFKPIFYSASASAGMVMIISLLKIYVLKTVSFISVLSLVAIGGICYLGFIFAIYRTYSDDLSDIIKAIRTYNTRGQELASLKKFD